ncbi:MAG: hypothetical protein QGD92_02090 [Gammaproteobacteria bacterium]|nr:hypothetical protein [Gammaproteobacteria bacterium]
MKITFVKKILVDGNPCPKCADVEKKLRQSGNIDRIDEVLIADVRDPDSAGMQLANDLQVTRAPFFVVERDGDVEVFTVYFKFVKQVLGGKTNSTEEAAELLNDNPDLDYI